jgi:hypothetical protein
MSISVMRRDQCSQARERRITDAKSSIATRKRSRADLHRVGVIAGSVGIVLSATRPSAPCRVPYAYPPQLFQRPVAGVRRSMARHCAVDAVPCEARSCKR